MKRVLPGLILSIAFLCLESCKPTKQEWTPEIGVQLWTFKEFSVEEAIRKADSAGLKNIEVFEGQLLQAGSDAKLTPSMTTESEAALVSMARQAGIRINSAYLAPPADSTQWPIVFAFAKRLGLSYITMEPPAEALDYINQLAGEAGVPIALHNHPRGSSYYWHPDTVYSVIQNRVNLGACADIGHWGRSGLDLVQSLAKLNGRILGVHVKDITTPGQVDAADVPMGEGKLDLKAVLTELKKQEFKGVLVIEREGNWLNNTSEVKATADLINDLRKD